MNRRYRIRKKEPTAPFSFGKRACRETAEERHEATARIITLTHGGKSQVLRPGPVPLYAGSRLRQSSEGLSAKNGESDVLHPRQPRERTGTDVYTVSMQRRRKIRQSVRRRSFLCVPHRFDAEMKSLRLACRLRRQLPAVRVFPQFVYFCGLHVSAARSSQSVHAYSRDCRRAALNKMLTICIHIIVELKAAKW